MEQLMKIYLAGKIYQNDWRHSIVDGLGDECVYPGEWPVLEKAIFSQHDYLGPFFLSFGHGQTHCKGQYNHATDSPSGWHGSGEPIVGSCLKAIKECDLVFAYIESRDCFGTFFEIGYGIANSKKVVIAYAPFVDEKDDMWFQNGAAYYVYDDIRDPKECLSGFLPPQPVASQPICNDLSWNGRNHNPMQLDWRTMPDGRERRQAYYCSSEWESLRQQVIDRSHGYCEMCKSESVYLVHHLTYARLYKEDVSDLQGLCEKCHQRIHPSRSGVSSNNGY